MTATREPKRCIDCGEESELSQAGVCPECSLTRWKESRDQIKAKSGPHYLRWKAGILAAFNKDANT